MKPKLTSPMKRRAFLQAAGGTALLAAMPVFAQQNAQSGVFDAHFHIIDPAFPLIENEGYLPPYFTLAEYLVQAKRFDVRGGAVVSGSYQGYDQTYLKATLALLDENWVGVTQVPFDVADDEIVQLARARVRGIRFNIKRGDKINIDAIVGLANRVHKVANMHSEFYAEAISLEPFLDSLRKLPRISIDHLGLSSNGLPTLLKLVEAGAYVKASGFGRLDFEPGETMKKINEINGSALLFGSDIPSTRAKRPFSLADIDVVRRCFDGETATNVLRKNGRAFYRI